MRMDKKYFALDSIPIWVSLNKETVNFFLPSFDQPPQQPIIFISQSTVVRWILSWVSRKFMRFSVSDFKKIGIELMLKFYGECLVMRSLHYSQYNNIILRHEFGLATYEKVYKIIHMILIYSSYMIPEAALLVRWHGR